MDITSEEAALLSSEIEAIRAELKTCSSQTAQYPVVCFEK